MKITARENYLLFKGNIEEHKVISMDWIKINGLNNTLLMDKLIIELYWNKSLNIKKEKGGECLENL